MLREPSKMEQRYDAVAAVVRDGHTLSEVAEKLGVSRQSSYRWMLRYDAGASMPSPTGHIDRTMCRTRWPPSSRRASSKCGATIPSGDRPGSVTSSAGRASRTCRRAWPSTGPFWATVPSRSELDN